MANESIQTGRLWKVLGAWVLSAGVLNPCLSLFDNSVLLSYLHAWKYLSVEIKLKDLGTSIKYC